MLVSLKEIMKIAEERQIAVGSFNCPGLDPIRAIVAAAEELDLPVILQHAEGHNEVVPLEVIAPIMLKAAKEAKVPVCVHLDHGEDMDLVRKAVELGFSSVMYDGSTLPYEENLANTKAIVEFAHKAGAQVEAELGTMGMREFGTGTAVENDPTKIYTDPDQAAAFVKETGVDALACSFGTTHGIYLTEPKLDFNVVSGVRRTTGGIPVVMHGGSGVSRDDFHAAIRAGVRKINYFTYMDKAAGTAVAEYLRTKPANTPDFYTELTVIARNAMIENLKGAMKVFAFMD